MMLHLLPFIIQIKVRENRKGNQEGNSEKPATLGTIHRSNIKTKHGKLKRSTRTTQQNRRWTQLLANVCYKKSSMQLVVKSCNILVCRCLTHNDNYVTTIWQYLSYWLLKQVRRIMSITHSPYCVIYMLYTVEGMAGPVVSV